MMKGASKIHHKWQVMLIICVGVSMVISLVGWIVASREDEEASVVTSLSTPASSDDTTGNDTTENDTTSTNTTEENTDNEDTTNDSAVGENTNKENANDTTTEIAGTTQATNKPKTEGEYAIVSGQGFTTSGSGSGYINKQAETKVHSDDEQSQAKVDSESVQGDMYVWQDGDREIRAYLQTDLTVDAEGAVVSSNDAAAASDSGNADAGLPVFRSESGALMALPGGVLICLDPEWSEEQIETFFTGNSIESSSVSPIEHLDNCFEISTDPGFASLNLANTLASQVGVEIASPNWWTEASPT